MMIASRVSLVLALGMLLVVDARVYEKCHLARRLLRLDATLDDIATWVCIAAELPSALDTHKQNGKEHGIFQISEDWCSPSGVTGGGKCNVRCSSLRDNNISDDFKCAQKIVKDNGFEAWPVYASKCKTNTTQYVDGCTISNDGPLQSLNLNNRPLNNRPLSNRPGRPSQSRNLDQDDGEDSDYDYNNHE